MVTYICWENYILTPLPNGLGVISDQFMKNIDERGKIIATDKRETNTNDDYNSENSLLRSIENLEKDPDSVYFQIP